MKKLSRIRLGVLTLGILGVTVAGAIASPASAPPIEVPPQAIVVPMRVVGIDSVVAAEYQRKVAASRGFQLASSTTPVPADIRTADCGSSYLFLDAIPRGFTIRTGFSLVQPAVSYSWAVDLYGPSGFRETWGEPRYGSPTWDGLRNRTGLRPGEYRGLVTAPAHAVLQDGRICQSLGPADTKPVF